MNQCLAVHTAYNYYRFIITENNTIDNIISKLEQHSWDRILRAELYEYSDLDRSNHPIPAILIEKITLPYGIRKV